MCVLRGIDLDVAPLELLVVIGAMVGVPMLALVAGARHTQELGFTQAIIWVEKLETPIGIGCVRAHECASSVDACVPCIEGADGSYCRRIDIDCDAAMRPFGGDDFPAMRTPGFMNDPLSIGQVALVDQRIA